MELFNVKRLQREAISADSLGECYDFAGCEELVDGGRTRHGSTVFGGGVSQLFAKNTQAMLAPKLPRQLPENLFSRPISDGAAILQEYLDSIPQSERYAVLEPLVRREWKWFCKAAPHLKFPEPRPLRENEPIRLGIRVARMNSGGIGRVMQLLANHFASKANYDITIFVNSSSLSPVDYNLDSGVKVVPVQNENNLQSMIAEHCQDFIICPNFYQPANHQNAILLKSLGVRVVMQEHGGPTDNNPFKSVNEKSDHLAPLYSVCDGVSVLSTAERTIWRSRGLSNVIYLPNPPTFDVEKVTPSKLDGKKIIWIGRWDPVSKNPELAIRAFAKILEKVPDARLVMRGGDGGRCTEQCKQLVRKLKIGHAVDIGGFEKDLAPYYSSGAMLLCSSRFEGFPMGLQEAKTFGLPVVSTAMPYLETLKRGCVQVPHGDADALANAAVDLLQNDEKRKQLGAEARQDMIENFSAAITFGKYEALFDAIFKGKDAVRELCAAAA
ncbi:MAG: glycosyltransferase [Puniceicoccales bacterium]|nr:glycosyltransferase [Puniceicoccales bacterium]